MNETFVTVVGNLVDEPKLRVVQGDTEVASFRIASTSRRYDKETAGWIDGGTLFLGVTCWRQLAANLVDSGLHRGDPVVVSGKLSTRSYEKDGQTRSVCELEALALGPDLSRGTATFRRASRPLDDTTIPAPAATGPELGRLVGAGV